jgi:hypothetical protein
MSHPLQAFVFRLVESLGSIRSRSVDRKDQAEELSGAASITVDDRIRAYEMHATAHDERTRRRNMRMLAYSLPLTAMMCISHADASPASEALAKGFRFFCMRDVSTYRNIETYATAIRLTEASTQPNAWPVAMPVVDRSAEARAWIVPAYTGSYELGVSQAMTGKQAAQNCGVHSQALTGTAMVSELMHTLHLTAPLQDQRSGDGSRRMLVWKLDSGKRVTLEYNRNGRGVTLSTSNEGRERQLASN